VKFFRDGRPSANFVAMYSLDGQPCTDKDFFQHDWSNHITPTDNFGLKLIAAKFWQASYCPLMVGVSDLSSTAETRKYPVGSHGKYPFQLIFHPLVSAECPCDSYATCRANLEKLEVGSKLFEVRARADPKAEPQLIGHITLTDELKSSKFGDEQLFFSHQHMENDYVYTGWADMIDTKEQCGMKSLMNNLAPPPISLGCTSPFGSPASGMLASDENVVV